MDACEQAFMHCTGKNPLDACCHAAVRSHAPHVPLPVAALVPHACTTCTGWHRSMHAQLCSPSHMPALLMHLHPLNAAGWHGSARAGLPAGAHRHAAHPRDRCGHNAAQHSTAQRCKAQHGRARQGKARQGTAQHSTARHSTARHSTTQHITAQHSTAQHSAAQHRTAQHSAAHSGEWYGDRAKL
jgi:hypothetical protein